MKKMLSIGTLVVAMLLCTCVSAQTVKYRLVKYVDRNTGVESSPEYIFDAPRVIYVTFLNSSKSQFVFTDQNGKVDGRWGIYESNRDAGHRIFSCTGSRNNYNIFENKRPVSGISVGLYSSQVTLGYVTDYIYFSTDWSRFNIYSGGKGTDNGIQGAIYNNELIQNASRVAVYEKVESKPAPGGLY